VPHAVVVDKLEAALGFMIVSNIYTTVEPERRELFAHGPNDCIRLLGAKLRELHTHAATGDPPNSPGECQHLGRVWLKGRIERDSATDRRRAERLNVHARER